MDKKMLCVVLALASTTVEAEKITDAEVLAAISGLKAKADQADGLKVEVSALKAERDNSKITALIAGAIENKQILPAEKPHFEKLAKDDFPTAEALINARPKVTSISKELNDHSNPAPEDRTGWKYKDYMEKDPQALAKMAKDDLSKFKPLFKEHYGMEYTD
jgi:phage I-like protein